MKASGLLRFAVLLLLVFAAFVSGPSAFGGVTDIYCGNYSNSTATPLLSYGWACAGSGSGCTECTGVSSGGGYTVCVTDSSGTYCIDYQN